MFAMEKMCREAEIAWASPALNVSLQRESRVARAGVRRFLHTGDFSSRNIPLALLAPGGPQHKYWHSQVVPHCTGHRGQDRALEREYPCFRFVQ